MQSINQLTASNAALKAKMDPPLQGRLPITQQAAYIDANFPRSHRSFVPRVDDQGVHRAHRSAHQ